MSLLQAGRPRRFEYVRQHKMCAKNKMGKKIIMREYYTIGPSTSSCPTSGILCCHRIICTGIPVTCTSAYRNITFHNNIVIRVGKPPI